MFEANAFFPVNKELDQEEWPLMELTDATVFLSKRNNTTELEDLLDVQDRGPFRIEGILSPIADELKGIIRTKNTAKLYSEPLIITQVMMYSIQQFEDGAVKIWALGKCGWYSIIPSLEYESIFETMVEKGKLWVFLQDRYCDKYSGKGNIIRGSVADLYLNYTKLETIPPSLQSASQLFEKHYRYLLFEMCGVRADTDMWRRTPLFRHFSSKYPAELRAIRRSMACASDRMDNPATVKKETSSAPSSPTPSASAPQHLSGRPKVHNRSNSYTILALFFENIAKRNLKPTEITKNLIAQFVNNYFVFGSYQDAVANVDARAEDFLSIMEQPPLSMMYDWVETPAYKQLGFVRTSENDMAVRMRKLIPKLSTQADHYYDDEDDDEVGDVIGVGSVYIRSPVRPPAAAKGKSPARVPVRLQVPDSEDVDDSDPEDAPAVVALNQKRVLDDLLSPRSGVPTAKRPRTRTATTTATASSSDSSSSLSTLPLTSTDLQPGTNKPPCFATDPQATRTNSAGDRWECEISGCSHIIIDADSTESLQLIEKHYSEHAKVIKQAMDAIDGGKVLPSRPRHVNNLLAKIEQMARKWAVSSPAPLTPMQLGLSEPTSAQVVSEAEYLVTTSVTAHTGDPWTGHS